MRKTYLRSFLLFGMIFILALASSNLAFAQSGRTDSSGGHKDNKNASGLGSYHYHHGYPPHLHSNGICPYSPSDSSRVSSASGTSGAGATKHSCTVASNAVKINDENINKSTAEYPPLLYKDITYIPLTADVLNYLNLTYIWDNPDHLMITKNGAVSQTAFVQSFQSGQCYGGMGVSITESVKGLQANGQSVSSEYPVIIYKDIYYLPLTSEIMTALSLTGGWDPAAGFSLYAE